MARQKLSSKLRSPRPPQAGQSKSIRMNIAPINMMKTLKFARGSSTMRIGNQGAPPLTMSLGKQSVAKNMEKLCIEMLKHINIMKLFHFQTRKYSAHKAVDEYYGKLQEKFDELFEAMQGKFGKLNMHVLDIPAAHIPNDGNISSSVRQFHEIMKNMSGFYADCSDLVNIRDEIMAAADTFLYLLTLN